MPQCCYATAVPIFRAGVDQENLRLLASGHARAQTIALGSEGFWDIRRPSGRHELVAVNTDRRESDLDVLSAETLALWQNTGQGSVNAETGREAGSESKRSLWWYVLLAALALAVAETIVGNQHLSVDKEAA